MARKRKKGGPENHERWLVSYADFITLLFAFFVVMFATANSDKGKAAQISESVKKALEEGGVKAVVTAIMGGTVGDKGVGNAQLKGPGGAKFGDDKKNRQIMELLPSLTVLSAELKKEIAEGKIKISMTPRGLAISFKEATLFGSGEDVVASSAYDSIAKVAESIKKLPNPVRLEGHTDSIPIHTLRFPTNWDLSAARSIALLKLLSVSYGVPVERLSIGGYADTAPVDSNDSVEGRARNRRCDIVILNQAGAIGEPETHAVGGTAPPANTPRLPAIDASAPPRAL